MLRAIQEYLAHRRFMRNSMRELRRNGYRSVWIHGNATLAQKLHARIYGH